MASSRRSLFYALLLTAVSRCRGQYAVLMVKTTDSFGTVRLNKTCAAFNHNFTILPSAATTFVRGVTVSAPCPPGGNIAGLAAVTPVYGCSVPSLRDAGAIMVVLVSDTSYLIIPKPVPADGATAGFQIPVLGVSHKSGLPLTSPDYASIEISAYVPSSKDRTYLSEIALWVTAMLTIILSCLYSAQPYQFLKNGLLCRNGSMLSLTSNIRQKCPEKINKMAGVLMVLLFISIVCLVLVILYYFYYPMVYVVMAVFGVGACCSLYNCLSPLVALLPVLNCRIPPNRLPILRYQPDPKFFLTVGFSIAIVLWWATERNARNMWLLHNILGMCFIVFIISNMVELDTWILVLLLVAMLFYDVFFVFVSPYLFSGCNVMVQAATGGKGLGGSDSGGTSDRDSILAFAGSPTEMLPVLFNIPRYVSNELALVCSQHDTPNHNYVFLGYGDVAMPGMLVAQSLMFDQHMWPLQRIRVYFLVAISSYGLGLSLAFAVLSITESAQPALFYIVPCLLTSVLSTAAIRGHLGLFFHTKKAKKCEGIKPSRNSWKGDKEKDETGWLMVDSTHESESHVEV